MVSPSMGGSVTMKNILFMIIEIYLLNLVPFHGPIQRLISSTLLHFGKANELALRSASATPGKESKLSLLSLLRMAAGKGSRPGPQKGGW